MLPLHEATGHNSGHTGAAPMSLGHAAWQWVGWGGQAPKGQGAIHTPQGQLVDSPQWGRTRERSRRREARWDGGMRLLYPRKVRAPCVLQLEDLWARKFVR